MDWKKLGFLFAIVVLLIAAWAWVYVALSKRTSRVVQLACLIVGLAALAIMVSRDTYLPFLGETVFPCSALSEQLPEEADTEVAVRVPAGAKVLYWASEPGKEHWKELPNWRAAYLAFENVGVTIASAEGVATLHVRRPQSYTVPLKGRLEPHVHYRVCGEGASLGRVETVYLNEEGESTDDTQSTEEGFLGDGDRREGGLLLV